MHGCLSPLWTWIEHSTNERLQSRDFKLIFNCTAHFDFKWTGQVKLYYYYSLFFLIDEHFLLFLNRNLYNRQWKTVIQLFIYYFAALVSYEWLWRRSLSEEQAVKLVIFVKYKNLCSPSYFQSSSGPDWRLCVADSGPWAVCLTRLL